ncbi:MAG TPA: hypothetical protein VHW44_29810 [Pseudonocardiaceae bacterium]|jgi:class 3 adenylate cyclase|nr:hypothetical protein [Pseudonocardiaceae bacterium]
MTTGEPDGALLFADAPRHRAIVAVDAQASTRMTNGTKAELRRVMYELVERAFQAAGITRHQMEPMIDRGDGVLVLIHPVDEAPKTLLLDTVMPNLAGLLAAHHRGHPDQRFRMRAVVHAGEVHTDGHGWFGEPLDVAFRLLDSPTLKRKLHSTGAPLVLVASSHIYRTLIRQGYPGIDHRAFAPLVSVRIADRDERGWVQVPVPVTPDQ